MVGDILIVDDDFFSAEFMRQSLAQLHAPVLVAPTARAAHDVLVRRPVDLVLLDATLPDASGFEVCHWLRQKSADVAIMFVTGRADVEDRRRAFALGADDFLSKPFPLAELAARVRATLHQRGSHQTSAGNIANHATLDPTNNVLTLPDSRAVTLTATEARIMAILLRQPGQFVSRETLALHTWGIGRDLVSAQHALDMHLRRMRAKIEPDATQARYIQSERGVGVRFLISGFVCQPATALMTGG
jgi:DNA-binding response OmpR family regulator